MIRTVFFGTPDLAVPFLDALFADADFEVCAVVTQPDEPVGRKQTLTAPPVKRLAEARGVELYQPTSLKLEEAAARLRTYDADLFVVVAYGKIIPASVLHIPRRGCVNVHPSLLPHYRGPTPLNAAIANGDAETGITIMQLDSGMDTGPVLAQISIALDPRETLPTLTDKVTKLGPPLLIQTLKGVTDGRVQPTPQDGSRASITTLLDRDAGRIDWTKSCVEIDRLVRAYEPWPGTWTTIVRDGKPLRLKILRAEPSDRPTVGPGRISIVDQDLFISCADREIKILSLQLEGKSAMQAADFVRGYSDMSGAAAA